MLLPSSYLPPTTLHSQIELSRKTILIAKNGRKKMTGILIKDEMLAVF
jgi:hypothetical protein